MNHSEKNQYPNGPGHNNRTVNIQNYAKEVSPYFGNNLVNTGWAPMTTPPMFDAFRSTFVLQEVNDTFTEENETDWMSRLFPLGTTDVKFEAMTELRMNVFAPEEMSPGSPTGFTTTQLSTWLNSYAWEGIGFELSWFFFADEIGRKAYAWMVSGMWKAQQLGIRLNIWRRFNIEREYYMKWLVKDKTAKEAFRMASREAKEKWNMIHEVEHSFERLEEDTTKKEARAQMDKSQVWLIPPSINTFLRFLGENVKNTHVGQYNIDGGGALNKLEGIKDIYVIGKTLVCIQREIIMSYKTVWNPLHNVASIGEFWILRNAINDYPYLHQSRKRDIKIHNDASDRMTRITYKKAVRAAYTTLKNTNESASGLKKLFGSEEADEQFMAGMHKDFQDKDAPAGDALAHSIKTLHKFFRGRHATDETKEMLCYKNTMRSSLAINANWLGEFVAKNQNYLSASTLNGKNHYDLPESSKDVAFTPDYPFARAAFQSNVKTEDASWKNFVAYVEKMGVLSKQFIAKGINLDADFGGLVISDQRDADLMADFVAQGDNVAVVALHPELVGGSGVVPKTGGGKAYVDGLLKTAYNPNQYVKTALRWNESYGTIMVGTIPACVKAFSPNPIKKEFRDKIAAKRRFKGTDTFLSIVECFYLMFATTIEGLEALLDNDIELGGLNVLIARMNMGYEGANMLRVRDNGKTMMYKRGFGSVIISDDPNRQTHKIAYQQMVGAAMVNPRSFTFARNVAIIGSLYGCGTDFNTDLTRYKNQRQKTVIDFAGEASLDAFFVPASWEGNEDMSLVLCKTALPDFHLPAPSMELYKEAFITDYDSNRYIESICKSTEPEIEDRLKDRNYHAFHGACDVADPFKDNAEVHIKGSGHWRDAYDFCNSDHYGRSKAIKTKK